MSSLSLIAAQSFGQLTSRVHVTRNAISSTCIHSIQQQFFISFRVFLPLFKKTTHFVYTFYLLRASEMQIIKNFNSSPVFTCLCNVNATQLQQSRSLMGWICTFYFGLSDIQIVCTKRNFQVLHCKVSSTIHISRSHHLR